MIITFPTKALRWCCNYVFRLVSFETLKSGVNIYISISVFYVDLMPGNIYVRA